MDIRMFQRRRWSCTEASRASLQLQLFVALKSEMAIVLLAYKLKAVFKSIILGATSD